MPKFHLPKVHNARYGFFEEGEFAALLLELPPDVRDLVEFLFHTGWRRDEGRLLTWTSVDPEGGSIRLEGARSKSGEPRVFPFRFAPPLTTPSRIRPMWGSVRRKPSLRRASRLASTWRRLRMGPVSGDSPSRRGLPLFRHRRPFSRSLTKPTGCQRS